MCVNIEVTKGPYYVTGEYIRSEAVEKQEGILDITIRLQESNILSRPILNQHSERFPPTLRKGVKLRQTCWR